MCTFPLVKLLDSTSVVRTKKQEMFIRAGFLLGLIGYSKHFGHQGHGSIKYCLTVAEGLKLPYDSS